MGLKVVSPEPGRDPAQAPLDAGTVTVPFNETLWGWLHDVIADAHRQDRITVKPQLIIREAVQQLAQQGGWPALRERILQRRELMNRLRQAH